MNNNLHYYIELQLGIFAQMNKSLHYNIEFILDIIVHHFYISELIIGHVLNFKSVTVSECTFS